MADLEIIRKEIEKLEKLNNKKNHDEIVTQLQKINECFLRNVIIKINRLEIYPVEVEIYYYKEGVFEDEICHKHDLQKDEKHFGKLYFHRAGRSDKKAALIDTTYRGGVDVCLSCGNYYLSILLRSANIKNRTEEDIELKTGIHIIVNTITDELECLLENGKINIEYKICENQYKEEKTNNFCSHKRIKKENKKYVYFNDDYELNTFINNEEIIKKIYKDKDKEIQENLNKKLGKKLF